MNLLVDSVISALQLIVSFDQEIFAIVGVSLKVSLFSTAFASLVAVPLAFSISFSKWSGKRLTVTILNTLQALPTVVIGLFVYSFVSRRGMFGSLDLLYTQKAIVVGQIILIIPMITAFTLSAISSIDPRYRRTAVALGANHFQAAITVFQEARFGVMAAIIAAFGRVISEIGISMMLGGNIKWYTRTMTTAMALEYDKGAFVLAGALGRILMSISFTLNFLFHFLQGKVRS